MNRRKALALMGSAAVAPALPSFPVAVAPETGFGLAALKIEGASVMYDPGVIVWLDNAAQRFVKFSNIQDFTEWSVEDDWRKA